MSPRFVQSHQDLQSLSDMDEWYERELLRKDLIDAQERKAKLQKELQYAQAETIEAERQALHFKRKYQEIDNDLEAQEAETNRERLARERAEGAVRQAQSEVKKARRDEAIANEHCDSAEGEVIKLQKELSRERSVAVALRQKVSEIQKAKRNEAIANDHCDLAETEIIRLQQELSKERSVTAALREDLRRAGMSETAAYVLIDGGDATIRALRGHLDIAKDRIRVLEVEAERREECFEEEQERLIEAEEALAAVANELKTNELKCIDIWETDLAQEAGNVRYDLATSKPATDFDTDTGNCNERVSVDTDENGATILSGDEVGGKKRAENSTKNMDERMTIIKRLLAAAAKDDAATSSRGMPLFPERAIVRPRQASMAASGGGRCHTLPYNAKSGQVWRKCPRNFSLESLRLLFQGAGWR